MSSLSETLENVRTKIAKHKGKNLCEADTKAALIHPVLGALGWHVGDLDEVSMEFKHAPSHNPVDYALLINGNPAVLVEAKALGQSLAGGKWADAIMGYAGAAGVEWVVLTNGDEYRIYNACVPVPFEQKLFRKVSVTDSTVNDTEETLGLLCRERIDGIKDQWERHFADRRVRAVIEMLLSPASGNTLAYYVKKHVKGLTPKEIRASLVRVCSQVRFPAEITIPPPDSKRPATLKSSVDAEIPSADSKGSVSLKRLIDAGILRPGKLTKEYKGTHLQADLLPSGAVRFQGNDYESCSAAGEAAKCSVTGEKKSTNGWTFWQSQNANGKLVPLLSARREYERNQMK